MEKKKSDVFKVFLCLIFVFLINFIGCNFTGPMGPEGPEGADGLPGVDSQGNIYENTTWTASEGPYILERNIVVKRNRWSSSLLRL